MRFRSIGHLVTHVRVKLPTAWWTAAAAAVALAEVGNYSPGGRAR
jgi:hypothetical protein